MGQHSNTRHAPTDRQQQQQQRQQEQQLEHREERFGILNCHWETPFGMAEESKSPRVASCKLPMPRQLPVAESTILWSRLPALAIWETNRVDHR